MLVTTVVFIVLNPDHKLKSGKHKLSDMQQAYVLWSSVLTV